MNEALIETSKEFEIDEVEIGVPLPGQDCPLYARPGRPARDNGIDPLPPKKNEIVKLSGKRDDTSAMLRLASTAYRAPFDRADKRSPRRVVSSVIRLDRIIHAASLPKTTVVPSIFVILS